MESTERIGGPEDTPAANLFAPDSDDELNLEILTKNALVSPTEEQYSVLHALLTERLLQGETIYEIGSGGKSTTNAASKANWIN